MLLFAKACILLNLIGIKTVFSKNEEFLDLIDYSPLHEDDSLFPLTHRSSLYHVRLTYQLQKLELENLWYNYKHDYYYIAAMLAPGQLPYCQNDINKICTNINNMNERVQRICTSKTICNHAYNEIMTGIKKTAQELSDKKISEHDKCNKLQMRCFLFEHHGMWYLNEKCKELKEHCYNRVRMETARTLLYDILRGTSNDSKSCLARLKNICQLLNQQSPELFTLCIDCTSVCNEFISYSQEECKKFGIQFLSKHKTITQENCVKWLGICYYAIPDCQSLHSLCRLFRMECSEKGFFYNLNNHNSDLFKNPSTDLDETGVQHIYEKLRDLGIHVTGLEKYSELHVTNFLVQEYLTQEYYPGYPQCKKIFDQKCSSIQYLKLIKDICTKNSRNTYSACYNIYPGTKDYCYSLKIEFKSNIWFWSYPDRPLSKEKCKEYLLVCYFMHKAITYWLSYDFCKDIRLVCYQAGLESAANMALIKKLNGKLALENDAESSSNQNKCEKALLKECNQFMYHSYHVLYRCLHPKETCKNLTVFVDKENKNLNMALIDAVAVPDYDKCKKYKKECHKLGFYFQSTKNLCEKLNTTCKNIDKMILLGIEILKKGLNFYNQSICFKHLTDHCTQNSSYSHTICHDKTKTCNHILKHVSAYCTQLSRYLSHYKVFNNHITHISHSRCVSFKYHCKLLKGSCPGSLNNICTEIEEKCNSTSTQTNELNNLIKDFGEEISSYDKCYKKLTQKCKNFTMEKTMNISCANVNNTCNHLVNHLREICDHLALKFFKLLSINFNSTTECQKIISSCSSIGSSCNGINDKIAHICDNIVTKCNLPPQPPIPPVPPPPIPPPPVPQPQPPKPPQPPPPRPPQPHPQPPSPPPPHPQPPSPPPPHPQPPPPPKPSKPKPKPTNSTTSLTTSLPTTDSSPAAPPTTSSSPTTHIPTTDTSDIYTSITGTLETSTLDTDTLITDTSTDTSTDTFTETSTDTSIDTSTHASTRTSTDTSTRTSARTSTRTSKDTSITRSSTSTHSRHKPTISPSDHGEGYGLKAQGLQMIKLILEIVGIILGLWIII
ncbi:uncharacterized protein T551_03403 [Pneumocystis jirovecii RU7]|uniref:Uncharacterized protein n=1 Tax=Pneumocystis jirovecii (strain RU7) TaxID=1408657 RepID=A0A0W4ZDM3_PNEJ7|nr:uncharacterized protein T551_03403 [Pneumocystis jirovecii RU7]KTW26486.1 hypothetical protein T551_03403 [Pneumocystis jirovecii RU7]